MQRSNHEIAAAILLQTAIDHHPHLQAEVREQQPEPEALAELLAPFYNAILEKISSETPNVSRADLSHPR